MTDQLNEIEERWAQATPGPWRCWDGWGPDANGLMNAARVGPESDVTGLRASSGAADIRGTRADLEAVATAPADIAWLIGEIKRLRAGGGGTPK